LPPRPQARVVSKNKINTKNVRLDTVRKTAFAVSMNPVRNENLITCALYLRLEIRDYG